MTDHPTIDIEALMLAFHEVWMDLDPQFLSDASAMEILRARMIAVAREHLRRVREELVWAHLGGVGGDCVICIELAPMADCAVADRIKKIDRILKGDDGDD